MSTEVTKEVDDQVNKEIKALFTDNSVHHDVELISKDSATHDVRHFGFRLGDPELVSGIRPGKHIKIFEELDGKKESRFYSPVSDPDEKGHFELVLKVYPVSESDPKLGSFSRFLDGVPLGRHLQMSGPFGHLTYLCDGEFLWNNGKRKRFHRLGMIAGGTGITPMIQIVRHIFRDPDERIHVSLLCTNKAEEDVVFRSELEEYARKDPTRFRLSLTLTRASRADAPSWPYSFGRIDKEMVGKALSADLDPSNPGDSLVLICGRKDMNQLAKGICEELGFTDIHVY